MPLVVCPLNHLARDAIVLDGEVAVDEADCLSAPMRFLFFRR